MSDCPYCPSNDYFSLGKLGQTEHFRCRHCGGDFVFAPFDDEDQPEAPDDNDDDGRFSSDAEADEDAVGHDDDHSDY